MLGDDESVFIIIIISLVHLIHFLNFSSFPLPGSGTLRFFFYRQFAASHGGKVQAVWWRHGSSVGMDF